MTPRGLSRPAAAAYCGCKTLSCFDDQVRRGILPKSIPGTHTWDRHAIDAALDRASNLRSTMPGSAYRDWKARRDARQSQGRPYGQEGARRRA